jgi:tetratricopeptide (TPR) repeat protein
MSLWIRLFGRRKQTDLKPQVEEGSTLHASSTAAQEFSEEVLSPDIPPSPPFQSPMVAKQLFSRPPPEVQRGASTGHSAYTWKARPIFFSSTFKDMHAERDYLRDHTFPRLSEKLRDRCHYLNTIDLRQGVESAYAADEGKRELQVLTVCLDEIRRSKPFLVALLGDRYGWIPPDERITAAARAAGLPESVDVAGKSVTELEILYGVLENPAQGKRSWFYFRTLDRTGMPPEVSARFPAEGPDTGPDSPAAKLKALKDRIRRQMPDRVRDYTLRWNKALQTIERLDALDAAVEADLWSDLEIETAAFLRKAPRTWQEADARAVADFVAERIRGYVERPAIITPMLDHALSPHKPGTDWGLVVTGESGGGKSSLFGSVFQSLHPRSASGEILLLSHAVGIFPLSGQVDRMLRRWVGELALFLDFEDPLEQPAATASKDMPELTRPGESRVITSEEIEKTFATLLTQAATRIRVVSLIDALNQFEPTIRAGHLTWLPRIWPENARFLATAIAGTASAALKGRPGCRELVVPPVSREEALLIAEKFYRERYHRDVNPRVLDALLEKKEGGRPAHGNPLWLALALQEMNLLEADDYERADREFAHLKGAQRMEALQLAEAARIPGDVPGAYGELLDRAERLFGKAWTRSFTDLIALGRAGWRESDLQVLMPQVSGQSWDNLAFAGLRRTLGNHVVQRGAHVQWDFFHTVLRETVLHRNLADKAGRHRLHGLLVDHLETLKQDDPIRISETMVHLLGLGHRDRAAEFIAGVTKAQWADPQAKATLAGAVSVLVGAIQAAADEAARGALTSWIAALMEGDSDWRSGLVASAITFDVNDALAVTGSGETEVARSRLLEASRQKLQLLVKQDPSNTQWQRDLSITHIKIGDVLVTQGDLNGALRAYRESHVIFERLAIRAPSNVLWQRDLSYSQEKIGDVLVAQGDLEGALLVYLESETIRKHLATQYPRGAQLQHDLSVSHGKTGDVLLSKGDLEGALLVYLEFHAILDHLATQYPRNIQWQYDLGNSNERLGDVLLSQGYLTKAKEAYEKKREIISRLAAQNPLNTVWQRDLSVSHSKIGDVLRSLGDLAGALRAYREAQAITELLAALDPRNTQWQHDLSMKQNKIGDLLESQGDLAGAMRAYRESLTVRERQVAWDPSNVGWQRGISASQIRVGNLLKTQGDLVGALRAYREAQVIIERLAAKGPLNAMWQRDLFVSRITIGNILQAQGDQVGALRAYREAQVIIERLAAKDPRNTQWQHDLSLAHSNIGAVLQAKGDLAGALKAYRESLSILQRLAAADPSNAMLQRDLAVYYGRIAQVAEEAGQSDATAWWNKAYATFSDMKRRGIMLPTDEPYLSTSKMKSGML